MDALYSIGFGTSLLFSYLFYEKTKREARQLNLLQQQKKFSPKAVLEEISSGEVYENYPKFDFNNKEYVIRGAIQGLIDDDKPFTSSLDPKLKLVFAKYWRDEYPKNKNNYYRSYKDQWTYGKTFNIVDPKTKDFSCKVEPKFAFLKSNSLLQKNSREEITKKISFPLGYLGFAGFIQLRYSEKEIGLKIGDLIAVFGDIIYNTETKSIRIDNPIYIARKVEDIISKITQKMIITGIFTSIFTILTYYFGRKLLKIISKNWKEFECNKKPGNPNYLEIDDIKCQKCFEDFRNIIFLPCQHLLICKKCLSKYPKKSELKCTLCNEKVNKVTEVYIN